MDTEWWKDERWRPTMTEYQVKQVFQRYCDGFSDGLTGQIVVLVYLVLTLVTVWRGSTHRQAASNANWSLRACSDIWIPPTL